MTMRSALTIGALAALAAAACTRTPDPARPAAPDEAADLEGAAMPFRILALPGGGEISWDEFLDRVAEVDAICVGEQHSNPHHHWAQLQVVEALVAGGARAALGMEMFQRPFQGVLDDYAAGHINEDTMLARTGWNERWGFDYGLYRPMVEAAVRAGADLVALNAPREIVRKVSRGGFEALSPSERRTLPELDLEDEDHQAWFWEVMEQLGDAHGYHHGAGASDAHGHDEPKEHGDEHGEAHAEGHGGGHGGDEVEKGMSAEERLYAAQVIWDETMADAAADWLADQEDGQIVLLTGSGHCHDRAVVARIERRGDFEAASVLPIIESSGGRVAELLARPRHDFLFVMTPPSGAGHD
jgi:uncharacterized iron-regulated protein